MLHPSGRGAQEANRFRHPPISFIPSKLMSTAVAVTTKTPPSFVSTDSTAILHQGPASMYPVDPHIVSGPTSRPCKFRGFLIHSRNSSSFHTGLSVFPTRIPFRKYRFLSTGSHPSFLLITTYNILSSSALSSSSSSSS